MATGRPYRLVGRSYRFDVTKAPSQVAQPRPQPPRLLWGAGRRGGEASHRLTGCRLTDARGRVGGRFSPPTPAPRRGRAFDLNHRPDREGEGERGESEVRAPKPLIPTIQPPRF